MQIRSLWVALAFVSIVAHADATDALWPLRIGSQVFRVEVADTPASRERGLMGRRQLSSEAGMLFVFEHAAQHCFWMRDTPVALSIAFIDASGRIVNLADMQPQSDTLHCASDDVRYALEISQGGFVQRRIGPGHRVTGLPR